MPPHRTRLWCQLLLLSIMFLFWPNPEGCLRTNYHLTTVFSKLQIGLADKTLGYSARTEMSYIGILIHQKNVLYQIPVLKPEEYVLSLQGYGARKAYGTGKAYIPCIAWHLWCSINTFLLLNIDNSLLFYCEMSTCEVDKLD